MRSSAGPNRRPVRLIHLADYGGTYPGSFIPMIRSVLQLARERGWLVEAVFSKDADERAWLSELRAEGFACTVVPAGRAAHDEIVERLCAQADGPVILHSHFTTFDLPVATAARRHRRVIAYWHLHSALRPGVKWTLRNAVKLGVLSQGVEQILCVAPNILEQARRRLAPRSRLELVPNAIDLSRFPVAGADARRTAREALGLPLNACVALHFGWDWQRKGGDIFLRALALSKMANVVAVTVADEQPAMGLAESLGIADRLRVLPPSDDVASLYAAANVFVASSRGEGHPFAVAEAIASGLPVLASPIPGHEMIATATTACRIVALDPAAFASAIADAFDQTSDDRSREQSAARAWAIAQMEIDSWSERMLARYEHALTSR
jgi:glycosyltransferase involved in cell wall biosynthesis